MSTTIHHMCIDCAGALKNMKFPDHYWGTFQYDDGTEMHPVTARKFLQDSLSAGKKVIPCAPCDNFDYSGRGCLGHPVPEN